MKSSSAPGHDKISYFHLKQLPSCHHFLATLFSKILLQTHSSPSWCSASMILVHKNGDASLLSNFRPIALTSAIGKLFHKIIATRLERYIIDNDFIDVKIQKGFLSGISGVLEHIMSLNTIMENAKQHHNPLYVSFLDLKNAFGSIPHGLISDVLHYVQVPLAISEYINNVLKTISLHIY